MKITSIINRWRQYYNQIKNIGINQTDTTENFENTLNTQYQHLAADLTSKQLLKSKEYKVYSQNGEDGLLLYIFDQIGVTNRTLIEFGIGNGLQCNTANLLINFNWNGLLIEGDHEKAKHAKIYYASKGCSSRVNIASRFITKDNINDIFNEYGINGEIDLLSIDIDGNDYWVWKAINIIQPRVVVIEYNASLGPTRSITIPYKDNFNKYDYHSDGWYHGASVKALEKLGQSKKYSLIGCDSRGVNMFFVKDEELKQNLPILRCEDAWYSLQKRDQKMTLKDQYEDLTKLNFESV